MALSAPAHGPEGLPQDTMPFRTHQRSGGLAENPITNANGPIRVLLADDHTMFREGLVNILASYGGMEVVAEVPNDGDALKLARELSPDVVIMQVQIALREGQGDPEGHALLPRPPEGGDRHHVGEPPIRQGAYGDRAKRLRAQSLLLGAFGGGHKGCCARPQKRERRCWDARGDA